MVSLKRISLMAAFMVLAIYSFNTPATPSPKKALQLSLLEVVDTKTPRSKSYDYFAQFEGIYLDGSTLVFRGRSDKRDRGLYTTTGGDVQLIAERGTIVPGTKRSIFYRFTDNLYVADSSPPKMLADKIIFIAEGYDTIGIYQFYKNKIEKIVDTKTPIPDGAKGLFIKLASPGFMGSRKIGFLGEGENFNIGIYSADKKGKLKTLIDNKTAMPKGEGNFTDFKLVTFANSDENANDFAFWGRGKDKQFGIFFYQDGKIKSIIRNGEEIPGGVGHFQHVHKISFDSRAEQIAFIGEGILGQQGIYLYGDGKLVKLIDQLTIMPHEEDQFNEFKEIILRGGKVVFFATGHKKQEGIYIRTQEGLFKVISNRDKLNKLSIKHLSLGQSSLAGDRLPFLVTFKNGRKAIFIAETKIVDPADVKQKN